ncbi:hypothetical protein F9B74_06105 [Pelistega sp. NLN82]|uniref:Tetratricopeptide repeat protein n=1 Tax=Pelistega ratti TaxID=2652177 RepID=A0A6L9Y660_9BURK|nr:hypothetical protein [Pelistega ratti]NEN75899.1 hypothetical protein [Pelistega ratti]
MKQTLSIQSILDLENNQERESAIIKLLNQALQDENYSFAREIAEFILYHNIVELHFSYRLQLHSLSWLSKYYYSVRIGEYQDNTLTKEDITHGTLACALKFRDVIPGIAFDVEASPEEIEKGNDQMFTFYTLSGLSTDSVYRSVMLQCILMGDEDSTREILDIWQSKPACEQLPDCQACVQHSLVEYHHFLGDFEQALKAAIPILEGKVSCKHVPQASYYPIIDSLIRLGQHEQANMLLDEAITQVEDEENTYLFHIPYMAQLLTRLNHTKEASELLQHYNNDLVHLGSTYPFVYLQYLIALTPYHPEALSDAKRLAKLFDERNENNYYQAYVEFMYAKTTIH